MIIEPEFETDFLLLNPRLRALGAAKEEQTLQISFTLNF